MKKAQSLAYFFLICRSLIYGSTFLFVSNLLQTTEALDVLALRFLISAAVFSLLAVTRVIHVKFRGKTMRFLLAAALFEPVGYFLLETLGLQLSTTAMAGIIAAFSPVMTILFETVFLKEKPLPRKSCCYS